MYRKSTNTYQIVTTGHQRQSLLFVLLCVFAICLIVWKSGCLFSAQLFMVCSDDVPHVMMTKQHMALQADAWYFKHSFIIIICFYCIYLHIAAYIYFELVVLF